MCAGAYRRTKVMDEKCREGCTGAEGCRRLPSCDERPHASRMTTSREPAFLWTAIRLSIPVNLLGAVTFSAPLAPMRALVGMPALPSSFAWMLSAWVLAFGLAFLRLDRTRVLEPTLLAVSALGKLTFVLAMVGAAATGDGSWLCAVSTLPDLALAVVFAYGLFVRATATH